MSWRESTKLVYSTAILLSMIWLSACKKDMSSDEVNNLVGREVDSGSLQLSSTRLNFELQDGSSASSATEVIMAKNISDIPIYISQILLTSESFEISQDSSCVEGVTINTQQTCELIIGVSIDANAQAQGKAQIKFRSESGEKVHATSVDLDTNALSGDRLVNQACIDINKNINLNDSSSNKGSGTCLNIENLRYNVAMNPLAIHLQWQDKSDSTQSYLINWLKGKTPPSSCQSDNVVEQKPEEGLRFVLSSVDAESFYSFRICSVKSEAVASMGAVLTASTIIPTVALSSSVKSPTTQKKALINVTFNKPIQSFVAQDVVVTNGTIEDFKVISDTQVMFNLVMKEGVVRAKVLPGAITDDDGLVNINGAEMVFIYGSQVSSVDYPRYAVDRSAICKGTKYYNSGDELVEGTRDCNTASGSSAQGSNGNVASGSSTSGSSSSNQDSSNSNQGSNESSQPQNSDTQPPAILSFTIETNSTVSDGYINDAEKSVADPVWKIQAYDYDLIRYTLPLAESVSCDDSQDYSQTSMTIASDITSDGTFVICAEVSDNAGNKTYGKADTAITRDTVMPQVMSFSLHPDYEAADGIISTIEIGSSSNPVFSLSATGYDTATYSNMLPVATACDGNQTYSNSSAANIDELSNAGSYKQCVRLVDSAGNISYGSSEIVEVHTPCPEGYIGIPGDADYKTNDFCVMKYEAKQGITGKAVASASGTPWVAVQHEHAKEACLALGHGYELLRSNQWMTIASNVAQVASNWSGSLVGSGSLARGHSDGSPASLCAASENDSLGFVESNCIAVGSGGGESDEATQRRTLSLLNGAVIWDLSGNAAEFVNYFRDNYKANPVSSQVAVSQVTGSSRMPATVIKPAMKNFWDDNWDLGSGIGSHYLPSSSTYGYMARGGDYNDQAYSGIFGARMLTSDTSVRSDTGFRCAYNPGEQESVNLTLVPGASTITATWQSMAGASSYLLVRSAADSGITFKPTNGTSYSPGDHNEIIYVGSGLSYEDTGLTTGSQYTYSVYQNDGSDNYTVMGHNRDTTISCPTNWVLFPGDKDYGTGDMCVMKYEAKNVSYVATPNPTGSHYLTDFRQSIEACNAIGVGYHLITNDEWMAAASHLASVDQNWSGGEVGSGHLYRGHTDNNPSQRCSASTNDSLAYVEGSCTPIGSGQGEDDEQTQRRTHYLENGAVVWDMAGNAREWVDHYLDDSKIDPVNGAYKEHNELGDTDKIKVSAIFPIGKSFWNNSWNASDNSVSRFYTHASYGFRARGGHQSRYDNGGLFSGLNSLYYNGSSTGVRCVISR